MLRLEKNEFQMSYMNSNREEKERLKFLSERHNFYNVSGLTSARRRTGKEILCCIWGESVRISKQSRPRCRHGEEMSLHLRTGYFSLTRFLPLPRAICLSPVVICLVSASCSNGCFHPAFCHPAAKRPSGENYDQVIKLNLQAAF